MPTAAPAAKQSAMESRRSGAIIIVGGFSCLVVALQQTLVVPALPRFPALLNASSVATSWVVTITLLTGAVATPIIGRLSDLLGRRKMMVLAMVFVLAGSLLAPLGGIGTLIVGRGLQGAGTALVPVAMAQMRDSVPPKRISSALAILSATLGVGGGIGIPLGGIILDGLGWQWMFWVSALLSLASIAAIMAVVPASPREDSGRFDMLGALGIAAALTLLLLALAQGEAWGWTSPATLICAAAGMITALIWGRHELRTSSPLVNIRTTAARPILATNAASIVLGVLMFTNLLLTTLRLQGSVSEAGFGWSAAAAGLAMLPNAAAMFIVAPLAARLATRWGARSVLIIGSLVTTAGYVLATAAPVTATLVIAWTTIIGIGVGIGYAALPMLIAHYAPVAEMGAAQGVNALMRAIGTAISSAVVAALSAAFAVTIAATTAPSHTGLTVIALLGCALGIVATVLATLARPCTSAIREEI